MEAKQTDYVQDVAGYQIETNDDGDVCVSYQTGNLYCSFFMNGSTARQVGFALVQAANHVDRQGTPAGGLQ